ncbi:MAG: bifunctional phosphoribosyl-AMP cyclohydrolase/phosphoribosyl-ATP diphosphatase HisIE [Bacteroidaceae bacterium]|nr:bifunctional phosphoribosyl-AMP cyclohydrolase/phosphoribosyl-ATP diphosphatase HisIE [Bacteroidaceae bacterium]
MNIDFDKMGGLVPAIIQDADTRQVLMLGYMNREAYEKTVSEGRVTFYSRTRKCLWTKGETSGNFLTVVSIKLDCDQDTLLIRVHPAGPVCHTGTDTCWGEENTPVPASSSAHQVTDKSGAESDSASPSNPLLFLSELQDFIEQRHREMPEGSYTTSLFRDGLNRMAQKVGEEALELVIEACNGTNERMIYEGSDMIYHLIVLLTSKGLRIEDLAKELQERHNPGWKKH